MQKKSLLDSIYDFFEQNYILGYFCLILAVGVVITIFTLAGF